MTMLLRRVKLPVPGILYLHAMPGRNEPIEQIVDAIAKHKIVRVVCLAPLEEIAKKSPTYFQALSSGVPWDHDPFPIPDYGVPKPTDLWARSAIIAETLRNGNNVLVHCAAGIGRTGTFATAVGMQIGLSRSEAQTIVKAAGSGPETEKQKALLAMGTSLPREP